MRHLVGLGLSLILSTPAWAGVNYTSQGRVVNDGQGGVYPPVTITDVVGVGAIGTGMGLLIGTAEAAIAALLPASIITWGAVRTSKYRPQEVKDQIHANLAKQELKKTPGIVWELVR